MRTWRSDEDDCYGGCRCGVDRTHGGSADTRPAAVPHHRSHTSAQREDAVLADVTHDVQAGLALLRAHARRMVLFVVRVLCAGTWRDTPRRADPLWRRASDRR